MATHICQQCRKKYRGQKCPRCQCANPTPAQIRHACERIRSQWPEWRLQESERRAEVEIPTVHVPTDHMVRRDGNKWS
jgi:hypothetical protein